jgi:hypothetical protein
MKGLLMRMGALVACGVGAWLMASALFGHAWWVGQQGHLEVRGGVIDVLLCSPADDPNPLPMGVGDHEGCAAQSYADNEVKPGSWFLGPMHLALGAGGGAAGLFFLFVAVLLLAHEFEVVPQREQLAAYLFDVEGGAVQVHHHPGRQAGYLAVLSLVALGIASTSAPTNLEAGPDLFRFAAGAALALVTGFVADPRVLAPASTAQRLLEKAQPALPPEAPESEAGHPAQAAVAGALPEAEAEESDDPSCVRCGRETRWVEKAGRHRCVKCGLYQPLHAPGSQVDSF